MTQLKHNPDLTPDGRSLVDLQQVAPASARLNSAGHLEVAGVDLVSLAQQEGTALYVMDEQQIRQQLAAYRQALAARWKHFEVVYAAKAFFCQAMARLAQEEEACLDLSGGGELAQALAAGYPADAVVLHGNNKTPAELREALAAGVGIICVDSFEEIDRLEQLAAELDRHQEVILRLKPGVLASTHSYVQTGGEDSKFGFGIDDGWAAEAAARVLRSSHLELMGLHFHLGSQILDFAAYEQAVVVLFDFIQKLRETLDWRPIVLDVGGGVGVAYQATDELPSIDTFIQTLVNAIEAQCMRIYIDPDSLYLFVEPGRSIVARAGLTLYTIGAIKELAGIRTYVAVDGGLSDNIRTALYDAHYECLVADRAGQPRDSLVTVVGKHCESGDVLAIDASLQSPRVGDTLAILGTGAYNSSMASNYNGQVRPAVVWLRDGQARTVVRRENYDDLLRRDVV